jgi:hypothetical protein
MSCLLRDHFDSYELLGFGDQVPEGYELANRRHDARSFLSQFWGDYFATSSLRSFLSQQRSCDLSRMDDAEVLRQVAYCLESGQAKLAVRKRERETYLWVPPPLEIPVPAPPAEIAPYHDVYAVDLTHLYHDDDPIQEAEYELELEDGEKVKGRLSKKGKASIKNLASPPKRVRYGEDQREFQRVDHRKNADYKPPPKPLESITFNDPDIIEAQGSSTIEFEPDVIEADGYRISKPENNAIVNQVNGWLLGVVKGGFNEDASKSQIIVDAVIGMIPLIGDITAARDLIAVVRRLINNPEKRKQVLEWASFVLLLFALVPVLGGAIKGVGRLALKAGKEAGAHAKVLRMMIALLERAHVGKARTFLRELDLEKYLPQVMGAFRLFTQRLQSALKKISTTGRILIPESVLAGIEKTQAGLRKLAEEGEKMIPEGLKELARRLKAIQRCVYDGEYASIKAAAAGRVASRLTRPAEARLVAVVAEGKTTVVWEAKNFPFPPNSKNAFVSAEGFPDLSGGDFVKMARGVSTYEAIAAFSGTMRPVWLRPGTKIYRIVDGESALDGLFWSYRLPKGGREWREGFAVLEPWNGNGQYVELIVPEGGLWIWEGKTASQIEQDADLATFGQYLHGGETQVLVDFQFPANAAAAKKIGYRRATHWGETTDNVNVPEMTSAVQELGELEIDPKVLPLVPSAAATAEHGIRLDAKSGEAR